MRTILVHIINSRNEITYGNHRLDTCIISGRQEAHTYSSLRVQPHHPHDTDSGFSFSPKTMVPVTLKLLVGELPRDHSHTQNHSAVNIAPCGINSVLKYQILKPVGGGEGFTLICQYPSVDVPRNARSLRFAGSYSPCGTCPRTSHPEEAARLRPCTNSRMLFRPPPGCVNNSTDSNEGLICHVW